MTNNNPHFLGIHFYQYNKLDSVFSNYKYFLHDVIHVMTATKRCVNLCITTLTLWYLTVFTL